MHQTHHAVSQRRFMKLEIKNGIGAQKQLWFGGVLVERGSLEKVYDGFSTARSVLDIAGLPYDWEHPGAKGSSSRTTGTVIEYSSSDKDPSLCRTQT